MRTLAGNIGTTVRDITSGRAVKLTVSKLLAFGLLALSVVLITGQAHSDNYVWTERTNAGYRNWTCVASSSDGTKIAACNGDYNGYLYTSTDSGATWTARKASGTGDQWLAITSSADGTQLFAGTADGYLYTSTDSGATWNLKYSSSNAVYSLSSSSDASTVIAGIDKYTYLFKTSYWTSANLGMELVVSTASSADGTNFAVGDLSGYIHTSADSGVTWIKQTGSGNRSWITIASSSDGIKLAAADLSGYLYTSQDSGTSWTATTKSMNNTGNWMTITSSADGTSLAAAADSENNDDKGHIYTSTDSGATWTEESGAGEAPWSQLASSSDASKLVAVSQNGYIYTGVEANYQAAAAATTSTSTQYSNFFGTKSGELQIGTASGSRYYVQWFTSGTGILAWTDGYLYFYYNNKWNELRIPWKPGLIKATACIDDAYLQYISYFGSKSGNVQLGTTTDGDYYVQWFTNGTAIIAWTDGYLYGYVRGTWQPFGIAWQQQV